MAAPHPLEHKRSTGYAPRIVAGGIDPSSSEEEEQLPFPVTPMAKVTPPNKSIPVIDPRLCISSSKVPPLIFMFVDALSNFISSVGALHGVGTILLW
jgi:hypothetical protein